MASVQNILLENPVQQVSIQAASKPDNSFQKLLQTKSNNAETDSEPACELDEPVSESLDMTEGASLQAENLIPMVFIPVLEEVQTNAFEQNEQPENAVSVNALSAEPSGPKDMTADLNLLSDVASKENALENAAVKPLDNAPALPQAENMELQLPAVSNTGQIADLRQKLPEGQNLPDKEAETAVQGKIIEVQTEEITVKQTEAKNDKLNLVKDNAAVQDSAVLAESAGEYVPVSDKLENTNSSNIVSAKDKLSASDSQVKRDVAQSADKITESKSFWENVSSRLTVRKEAPEQSTGNMGSQQFLNGANQSDTVLNSKEINSVNERLNQIFDLADQDNVLDQVVKRVEIDLKSGQTEMRMQLKPENLGEVQMKVVVEDGKLNAHFLTSTATAKEALEANVQQLKQSLQEQGVRVEKIAVLLSSGDLQFNQKQQDESLYQNQKISKNWRKSGIADYESSDEAVISGITDSNQILSAEQVDYRA